MIRLPRTWTATAAAAALLGSLALPAQAQPATAQGAAAPVHPHAHTQSHPHGPAHGARTLADKAQHQAAHYARLQTLLQLQPQQQAAWDAYVQASTPPQRAARPASDRAQPQATPARIAQQQQLRKARTQHIEQREQATLRLYQALNASQQKAFDLLQAPRNGHAHPHAGPAAQGGKHRHAPHPRHAPQPIPAAG